MTFVLRLAARNLLRAKRRAVLSSAAIVLGVFYGVAGQSFILGSDEGAVHGAIHGLVGHVTLRPVGYPTDGMDHPVDVGVRPSPAVRAWLDAHAEAWTERTVFAATLVAGEGSMRVRAVGYDPERDPRVFSRATWKGSGDLPRDARDGLMVTSGTARLLGVSPGDTVTLEAVALGGALESASVRVAAVTRTGNMLFDNAGVFLPDALAREVLGTDAPTHVSMRLADRDDAPRARAALEAMSGGAFEATDWFEECRELIEVSDVRRVALYVLVGMLLLMSSLAIASTLLMAAHERTREVGTLRALGMTRRGVAALFLTEGALLGASAGSAGALAGGAFASWLSRHPLDLDALKSEAMGTDVAHSAFIYGVFSMEMVLLPLAVAIAVALLASVHPARVAARMEPADAVRADLP